MVEAKVLQKIRAVLIADSTISGYVSDRVYVEHISSVNDPVYPAISMALLPGQARTDVPDMVNMVFQVDLWFPVDKHTVDNVLACFGQVRSLLHRQSFSDNTIGVKIMKIQESGVGQVMYDKDANCYHFPARYMAVAI